MNQELPDVQAVFRKGRGTRDQCANIHWITEKAREFQKNIYFCLIDYDKAFDYVGHTSIIRPPYLPPEKSVCRSRRNRTEHGTTDWFQIRKGVCQGCILSSSLFNLYAEYIMRKLGWKKHKLESRLLGEISITSDMQMTLPLWQKVKRK